VLAADTTVAIGQTILGKPRDAADAKRILTQLAGHTHDVYTAVVLHHNGQLYETLAHATVEFTAKFVHRIDQYIETQEPFGKAGAYAIQGVAAAYISKVQGSYSGVVGLPLYETAELLRTAGLFK
jgi:septum formation protein